MGDAISKKFVNFDDFADTLCKETPKNEDAKITIPIPKLIKILAKNTDR